MFDIIIIMNRLMIGNSCQLHRIYKISFENGRNYIGQTKKLPHERIKEHMRVSSKCTRVKEQMQNNIKFTVNVLAVTGSHNVDTTEKVAIALEKTMVAEDGLNMTIGGRGVKFPNEEYTKFSEEIRSLANELKNGRFVSWDVLFMKGHTVITEDEFIALRRLVSRTSR